MASRRANPALIGAFVLGAIALTVAAALVFGSGRLFRQTTRWVIYFDSSVTGLDVGAPVIFRGVTVGSVTEVDAYIDPIKNLFATPVFIDLIRGSVRRPAGIDFDPVPTIEDWVKKDGLRAQLKSQSLVTGKLYVDLGFHPDAPLDFKGLFPEVPEIPAVPTQLEEIEQTLRSAMERFSKLPLEKIADNLSEALASAKKLLEDPKLESAIANLDGTLAEARELVAKVNASYEKLEGDLDATLVEARKAFESAGKTLADADAAIADVRGFIEPGSPISYQLLDTLDEISQTVRSIRALSDAISRNPDQLIFGRGKPGDQP